MALLVEGAPPALDAPAVGGYLYIGLLGTVVAYAVWFRGLRELPAAAVSLVGLLNPVAGTVVGVALAGEVFGPVHALGMLLVLLGVLTGQPAVIAAVRRRLAAAPGGRPGAGRGVAVDAGRSSRPARWSEVAQPTRTLTSLDSSPLLVSRIRKRFSPLWPVWT